MNKMECLLKIRVSRRMKDGMDMAAENLDMTAASWVRTVIREAIGGLPREKNTSGKYTEMVKRLKNNP